MAGLASIDPRRSLAASAMWLIIGLAAAFSVAAAGWVGSIARENVLQQHIRRLSLETDQLSSEVAQALTARLDAVRAAGSLSRAKAGPGSLGGVFEALASADPGLDWIAVADPGGRIESGARHPGESVAQEAWFLSGLRGPWLGDIRQNPPASAQANMT